MAKYQKKNLPVKATPGLKKIIIKRNEKSTDYEVVDNNKDLKLNFLHQIVISDKKKDTDDNKLDYSTVKVVGFYNKDFDTVANFLGETNVFNLKNVEYHEEEVIFDIDNPSNEDTMVAFDGTPLIEITIDGELSSEEETPTPENDDKEESEDNREPSNDLENEDKNGKNDNKKLPENTSKSSTPKKTVKIIKH